MPPEDQPTRAAGAKPDAPSVSPASALTAAPRSRGAARVALPERVGHYRVDGAIGRGAMGVVARGWDERLSRPVALKFLDERFARDEDELLRVEREGRLLAAIRHPNVALIHGMEDDAGAPVLVLELVEGETLAERLSRGALDVDEALDTCAQVAAALEAAHARGIVHRDLKPGNIKLAPDGMAKVLDFGIACRVATDIPRSLASEAIDADPAGLFAGTPGYMSPEQIVGDTATLTTDTWALGCVILESLTGRPAFQGSTVHERIVATERAMPDLDALPESLPPLVRDLIARCLARDPAARPSHAGEVRHALETALGRKARAALPATAPSGRARLPVPRSSFIGRGDELAHLRALVATEPLVTLAGAGGSGKTRVALELALRVERDPPEGRFADGAVLVELGVLEDPALVVPQVAIALGLADRKGAASLDVLTEALATKDLLLILDNCEHLGTAPAELAQALHASCPRVSILATSREPLRATRERIVGLAPFRVPGVAEADDTARLLRHDSVALFVDRARMARRGFMLDQGNASAIARCCRQLDGIPLAIELAAARLRQIPIDRLADEIEQSFAVLSGGSAAALPRHQALRATIDWSHDLLDAAERALYRKLAVFAGPFTLELAEQVGAGSDAKPTNDVLTTLTRLQEKSLVQAEDSFRVARWRMLAPMRQHATEWLATSGEQDDVRGRFVDAIGRLAEESTPRLQGAGMAACLADLSDEHPNLVEAARLAVELHRAQDGLDALVRAGDYWIARGLWREGRSLLDSLLARCDESFTKSRAGALMMSAQLSLMLGEGEVGERRALEAQALFESIGDEANVAEVLNTRSQGAWERLDLDGARRLGEQSLALRRKLGLRESVTNSLNQLGVVARSAGDFDAARGFLEEALALQREVGNPFALAIILSNLAVAVIGLRDFERARGLLLEALDAARACSSRRGELFALTNLASIEIDLGVPEESLRHQREAAIIARELSDRGGALSITLGCARLALHWRDAALTARLLGAAIALRDAAGAKRFHNPALFEETLAGARQILGESRLAQEMAAGGKLGLEAALDAAVEAGP